MVAQDPSRHSRWTAFLWAVPAVHAVLWGLAGAPGVRGALWGFHAWTYLSPGTVALTFVAALLAGALVARASRFPTRPLAVLGTSLGFLALFVLLRDRTHLLGDGRLWISTLGDTRAHHPNEPLSFAGAVLATLDLLRAGPAAIARRMELVAAGCGAVSVALLLALSRRVATEAPGRWIAFGLLTASGVIQFGFGYVEAYPFLWPAVLAFFLLGLDAARGVRSPAGAGAALGLSAALHVDGFLLLPGLLAVLLARRHRPGVWIATASAALVPVAFAYLLLPRILPAEQFGEGGAAATAGGVLRTVGSLLAGSDGPRGWLLRQVNLWGLIAPGAAGLLLLGWKRVRAGEPGVRLLLVSALFSALPILFLDPDRARGAAADWDVFALSAVPVILLAAHLWAPAASARAVRLPLAATVAAGVLTTGSFVVLNASPDPAAARFRDLAATGGWTPHARSLAYETLAVLRRDQGRFGEAAELYGLAMKEQGGNARLMRIQGGLFSWAGRHREAVAAYLKAVEAEPRYPRVWLNLGMELERVSAPDSALSAYRRELTNDPRSVDALNRAARILVGNPATREEGMGMIERSLGLAPDQPQAAPMRRILRGGPPPGTRPDAGEEGPRSRPGGGR